jgi:hypothetical protein
MSIMLVLWIVWAVLTVTLLAMLAYRGTITRYEEDQIFLDDASTIQQQEQVLIVTRVNRLRPYLRAVTGATCVMSAMILGIYVWDAVRQFN